MLDITHYENEEVDMMDECECMACAAGQTGGAE